MVGRGKRPDDIEIYYFLNLRYGLMSGDDELKILDEVERTADRMAVYRIAKDFTNTYFQEEYFMAGSSFGTIFKITTWASRDSPGWIRTARVTVRWK